MTEREQEALRPSEWVLMPGVITLAVTLARLVGELRGGPEALFGSAASPAGALVGVTWLVPVFGIHFALKLRRKGIAFEQPRRLAGAAWGLAIGFAAVLLLGFPLAEAATDSFALRQLLEAALFVFVGAAGLVLARRLAPELSRALLLYGLAARVPVAAVMLVAMLAGWQTHYSATPAGYPELGPVVLWFLVGLIPQITVWTPFTVLFGLAFGSLAVAGVPRRTAHGCASALAV